MARLHKAGAGQEEESTTSLEASSWGEILARGEGGGPEDFIALKAGLRAGLTDD